MSSWATAHAPPSIGNVAVGFDVLGQAVDGPGDRVTVRRAEGGAVRITAIRGVVTALPLEADQNTAGRALKALLATAQPGFGLDVEIHKGIPLGSGMGGSAASAVAALVAANAVLPKALPLTVLYELAKEGEAAASGSRHGDNVAPMLLGGVTIAPETGAPVSVPVPASLWCAVVHPHFVLETRRAREALRGSYALHDFVRQSEHLALVLTGLFTNDLDLIRRGLTDILIEPRRAALIPGFPGVKAAALATGALGASISGAGPSVFAWADGRAAAERAGAAMAEAFRAAGQAADVLVSPVAGPAAKVEACGA
ncbi:MAG: homoserine kinase [Myxococcaceae bacterium]|nr:homoserine kinase [Myxococcaceae bacterium]